MTKDPPLARWRTVRRRLLVETPIFAVEALDCRADAPPRARARYVIASPDWVNVIPLTPEGRVVLVEQYRHGIEELSLEIPGGVIDPGDADPATAAARELREETGYRAAQLELLGVVAPNPAIQLNRCHCYLARDVRRAGLADPDEEEELRVVEWPLDEVLDAVQRGELQHALVVAAFGLYLLREQRPARHP